MIIAIAGHKGGVGKSTLACSLAVSAHYGRKVQLLDLDRNRSTMNWLMKRKEHADSPRIVGLGVLKPDVLVRALKAAPKEDLIIIDLPGVDNELTRLAIGMADLVVLPTDFSQQGLDTLIPMQWLIERIEKEAQIKLRVLVVVNNVPHNMPKDRKEARDFAVEVGLPVMHGYLIQRRVYKDAMRDGKGIVEMGDGKAIDEFERFVSAVLNQNDADLDQKGADIG